MELLTHPRGISFPLVPALAAATAAGFATIVATLPAPLLEALIVRSGLPAFVAMAEPPLGLTARALLFLGITALGSILGILALYPLFGTRRLRVLPVERRRTGRTATPRPISAHEELGAPFLSVRAGDRARRIAEDDAALPLPVPAAIKPAAIADMADAAATADMAGLATTPDIAGPADPVADHRRPVATAVVADAPAPPAPKAASSIPTRASILLGSNVEMVSAPPRASIFDAKPVRSRRKSRPSGGEDLLSMVGRLERHLNDGDMPVARGISGDEAAHVRAILDGLRPGRRVAH